MNKYITISIGGRHFAQGTVVDIHADGTFTICLGGSKIRGRKVN